MTLSRSLPNIFFIILVLCALANPFNGKAQELPEMDTTGTLPYPFKDQPAFGYTDQDSAKLYLNKPSNIRYEIEYDPVIGQYVFYEKVGSLNYRLPQSMSLDDYMEYDFDKSIRDYWRSRTQQESNDARGGLLPKLTIGSEAFNRIFGGNTINIQPQGYVEVSFGYQVNKTDNPSIPERLRKVPTFDFDEKIQMNVNGQIGTKMNMRVNYNTEATFDYENKMNLEYTGDEDEILKRIEAGNVSLPLNGSLITGASNLFGVKAEMQFGKLTVTTLFSQHRGESKTVETEGGAQIATFDISAVDYDANRHFFLAQYFRDHYNEWLKSTAVPRSPITINKVEIWVTNKSNDFDDSRNILAFQDLAEHDPNIYNNVPQFQQTVGLPYPQSVFPNNGANGLYTEMSTTYSAVRQVENITSVMSQFGQDFIGGTDFEKIEQARKLSDSEFTINKQLGYISLNSALNTDEVLAVAFNFTYNGQTFQVGEFSTDGIDAPKTLFMKLLKGTNLSPGKPTWNLMMKNIYNLNAYQLTSDDFELNVVYQNDSTGTYINYLPDSRIEGHILLEVMRLDMLNSQLDPTKDGVFDYVEGITVNSNTGRIIFPVVEPFGSHISDSLMDQSSIDKYSFQTLYDSTQVKAEQDAEHNKFRLTGSYKGSSSSDIALGTLNLTQGSVTVTAGGQVLTENVDYTVDYTLGRVKIINQALLEAGTPISVATESEDLFTMQRKTLMGTHANYAFSDNFNIGATMLWMNERPLTEKVDYGQDPISNLMYGLDARYNTEAPFLTKALDALPFYSTNAASAIDVEAEFAQLVPGSSKSIDGAVYVDDFEATKTAIDMRTRSAWMLASTPQYQNDMFPEANLNNSLDYGVNRAKLAWYNIDPLFLRNNSLTPDHIKDDRALQSNHLVREVFEPEIFPEREFTTGEPTNIATLDLAFYPTERGPYNYDAGNSNYSAGVNLDGSLNDPESRWGGIMREIQTSDFENANIEYIEFWMMDPFVNDTLGEHTGGDLYFNLGEISEDVLKDSRKSFENGLPTTAELTNVDTTIWGRVSTQQSLVNAFDNSTDSRGYQDLGFDGLNDDDEQTHFEQYLKELELKVNNDAYLQALEDPSTDNFHYFRGTDYDDDQLNILERYKKYNGPQGNSPTSEMSPENYPTSATTLPDIEDINDDNTLNEYERYYQYRISLRKEDMELGNNFISDVRRARVELKNGEVGEVDWYQFKIPVNSPEEVVGNISNFNSIRFMRMFMHGFADPTILRFATLDLVRADWRRYTGDILEEGGLPSADAELDIAAVSIEENSSREPVNYVLPPGVSRTIDPANPQLRQLNEQSIELKVTNLEQGDARAAYKSLYMDFRRYKTLKMEVHAEEIEEYPLDDDELYFFIRLGSDYNYNYYEYEVPLSLTPHRNYDGNQESERYLVWPDANRINIPLELFTDLKLERNDVMRTEGSSLSIQDIYVGSHSDWNDGKNRVKVKGSPNLGNVEVMMMGVRNKRGQVNTGPKSVIVWANELRLTDFDDEGGWAANARVSTRLADLGSVVVAGRKRTAGFGSIDENINSRSMDDLDELDVSASVDWGRFFPEKAGVRIPMYYGYSNSTATPKYDPLNPDIELKESLAHAQTSAEKDSIKHISQDVVERKSINFTNVKVEPQRQKEKTHLWDPENFAVTYSYNETSKRNITTEYNVNKTHRFMFSYNYSNRPKLIQPFSKVQFLQKGPLKLIGDFNFYPLPTQISYRTDLYRKYHERQSRNITNPNLILPATYDKDFLWNRYLDIRYDVTRSLKFDFSSRGTSRIDEPDGRINKNDDDYEWKRDSILTNLWNLGRPTVYNHSFNATYQVPIRSIKALNFMSGSVRYSGTYEWAAGSLTEDDINIGNVITNTRNLTLQGNANFQTLFNKVPYFKEVNQKFRRTGRGRGSLNQRSTRGNTNQQAEPLQKKEEETYTSSMRLTADQGQQIAHKLNTKKVKVLVTGVDGKVIPGRTTIVDANTIEFIPTVDAQQAMLTVSGKRGDQPFIKDVLDLTTRMVIGVRTFSATYNKSGGTVLPGFLPEPTLFGASTFSGDSEWGTPTMDPKLAPGLPFMFGWQDRNFAVKAAENGWLTIDSTLNQPFQIMENERINLRALWEPLPDLRIDLTANRSISKNITEFYNYDYSAGDFVANSYSESGNFSMTTLTLGTAFFKIGKEDVSSSDAFENMKEYRKTIAHRLADQRGTSAGYVPGTPHPNYPDYPFGYGPNSVEVLVPAFLAAYQNKDPESVSLSMFPSLKYIRPNWSIRYEGMVSRIPGLNKVMRSLNFQHTYRSTYNVGSYSTNLNFIDAEDGYTMVRDLADNFVPAYDFNTVSIVEAFNPLINIDIMWLSDLTTRGEIKRTRNLNMSLSNNQLTEILSNEYILGVGYRFTRMDLIIKTKNSQQAYSNDLNVRADISYRKTKTLLRQLDEANDQITAGQGNFTLKTYADYRLSDKFEMRVYYDRIINDPFTSLSYRTTNANFGVSFRFTLAN
ncbi:cell surface protein SprA [Draconibacterium sp. IB214405]|uniref:T9SS outer membrane translocon Sov/SprA n=1 Tax=Draconibacterium sp. IB214405 TaxID=3097352 RepID=UPI002A0B8B19|nr:cell surface protein SprA [Draconibacterium sp. IB214405]MDX8338758.1 cell surface protein SprA [Draconibacterium sp. IB214405]